MTWLTVFAWIVAIWLATTTLGQFFFTWMYCQGRRSDSSAGSDCVADATALGRQVAVVLAIRGGDEGLDDGLAALDQMDHPNYEIHLVLDHADDSAAKPCREFLARANHPVFVHTSPLPRCPGALKCDRLLWFIPQLSEDYSHVLLVDADVRVYPKLLDQLLQPFDDENVVCSGGGRWYEVRGNWPNLVRSIWNAAAVVQMDLYTVPWAGTWLWRRDRLNDAELRQLWSKSFCEDVCLVPWFAKHGYRFARPPQAVLINREPVQWRSLCNFWTRQLLCARLHHWAWFAILGHAINGLLMTLAVVLMLTAASIEGAASAGMLVGVAYLIYLAVSGGLMFWVCRENESRIESLVPFQSARGVWLWFRVLLAIPLAQVVHGYCALRAASIRAVVWRQIEYRIVGREVHRQNYQPYRN